MTRIATRALIASAVAAVAMTGLAGNASALSLRVKLACAADYYAHCSQHSPDTPGVRQCMRAVGSGLSKGCVSALIGAGEVSQAEVDRRRNAKTASK